MIYTEEEYAALSIKASLVTSFGLGDDFQENAPTMFYLTYQANSQRQYYPSSIKVADLERDEMDLNAGRFARFDKKLRANMVLSEHCPDPLRCSDWGHIERFADRIQWCADNVQGNDTWSLFVDETCNRFAFGFSNIDTAILFRLSIQ